VAEGVFASSNGRWGEVAKDPDEFRGVQLYWLDNDTVSSFVDVDTLGPVSDIVNGHTVSSSRVVGLVCRRVPLGRGISRRH
jgi:hypothetical protein